MAEPSEAPRFEDVVRRAFDANVRYWEAVGRASTDYAQAVLRVWADAPAAVAPGLRTAMDSASAAVRNVTRGAADSARTAAEATAHAAEQVADQVASPDAAMRPSATGAGATKGKGAA